MWPPFVLFFPAFSLARQEAICLQKSSDLICTSPPPPLLRLKYLRVVYFSSVPSDLDAKLYPLVCGGLLERMSPTMANILTCHVGLCSRALTWLKKKGSGNSSCNSTRMLLKNISQKSKSSNHHQARCHVIRQPMLRGFTSMCIQRISYPKCFAFVCLFCLWCRHRTVPGMQIWNPSPEHVMTLENGQHGQYMINSWNIFTYSNMLRTRCLYKYHGGKSRTANECSEMTRKAFQQAVSPVPSPYVSAVFSWLAVVISFIFLKLFSELLFMVTCVTFTLCYVEFFFLMAAV